MAKKGGFTTSISETISSFQLLDRSHLLNLPINGHTQNVYNSNFGGGKKTTKSKIKMNVKPTVKSTVKPNVKPTVKPVVKPTIKHVIKANVKK
jgi:hypothetical protein